MAERCRVADDVRRRTLWAAQPNRLREHPTLTQAAHDHLTRWLLQNADAPALVRCYREWQALLESPISDICHILETDDEPCRRLRQNSPFAGVLPPSEVWEVKAAIRQRHAKNAA